ncbi:hypothetical protein SAMN05421788_101431 [Filimonas lacunae]|uniref:LTXXQ motif family protein n=1 Tax=Filimonas lacunae TaxID=477680 RepID=A0A173MMW7_9BACT|nr:hypothetical protein [Filimonas lacunae]BAV08982.1 hypothetical protein FLA_5029 [Filimonas lacunae]SIS65215.1 hypothetical protein SAMN05421788_101431 [Filimonas lacunae]
MKKLILFVAAGLLATAAVQAQTPQGAQQDKTTDNATAFHPKRHHGKHKHGHFKGAHRGAMAHVQLTEQQRQQAHTIAQDYHKQATALKAQDNITVGEYKKQMAALQANRKQQMQQLLTNEQKQQIAQQKAQRAQQAQARGEARISKMKEKLKLTDDQVNKIKEQQASVHSQVKAIRENQSLDETAKRQQVRTIMQQQKDNFKSVLTKEQLDQLHNNLHKNRDVK